MMIFKEWFGVKLAKDFNDLEKGELFYVNKINGDIVDFVKQDDRKYHLCIPVSLANELFVNVCGLVNNEKYCLAEDYEYITVEVAKDFLSGTFIVKHSRDNMIVFEKGTEIEYIGQTQGGDMFSLDGELIEICDEEAIMNLFVKK